MKTQRVVVFYVVGALGAVVQVATLAACVGWAHLAPVPATVLAVEVAVVHNFLWHERWTWADRPVAADDGVWRRFVRFNLTNGVISIWGNVAGTALLAALLDLHIVVANALTIVACSVLTYLAADRLVFVVGRRTAPAECRTGLRGN